jgi:hypothetical protein
VEQRRQRLALRLLDGSDHADREHEDGRGAEAQDPPGDLAEHATALLTRGLHDLGK